MNKDAGRGNHIIVALRLQNGPELPFLVDTGAEATLLDKSLEPQLGKRRATGTLWNFGVKHKSGVYSPPKLYLGSTLLSAGDVIFTIDLKRLSSRSTSQILGILGMDCLRYYCIQFDFEAARLRFLDPVRQDVTPWGRAFPMALSGLPRSHGECLLPSIDSSSLIGGPVAQLLIDTGYIHDGALESGMFQREVLQQRLRLAEDVVRSVDSQCVWFPQCVWNSASYTNLLIGNGGTDFSRGNGEALVGLSFLARHLVTFDFPTRTLYLKQTSTGPLFDENIRAAAEYFNNLKTTHQLPGWSENDDGTIYCHAHVNVAAFDGRKRGDSATYHYEFARASKDSPWKLQKAWRADQDYRSIRQYPVP
jgi:hypothetical protein